jgi:hypothetical protein
MSVLQRRCLFSVPAFNLTFPATASTILSLLLPEDTVDTLGNLSTTNDSASYDKNKYLPSFCSGIRIVRKKFSRSYSVGAWL